MWVLLTIIAAIIFSAVNVTDKFVLTKWVRKPIVPLMILGVISLVASLFIYASRGFSHLSYSHVTLAFAAGIFYVFAIFLYFKAVKIEEVSRVVPLFYLTPLFVLIFAALFLGEVFTPVKYLGIFLLVIGAILISSKNLRRISMNKAFWFMVFSALALSVESVVTKYLLNFTDYWTVFSYIRIGTIFALVPIFYFYFPDLISTIKEHGLKVVAVMSLAELFNLVGVFLITVAISIGFVTLVEALLSVQPAFTLLFAVMLSIFYPKILKEETGKSVVLLKILAVILITAGAILII